MGGSAGAAAAAATTPVDVVKTRMMCSASHRPTIVQVSFRSLLADGCLFCEAHFAKPTLRSWAPGLPLVVVVVVVYILGSCTALNASLHPVPLPMSFF
jgi:hypothetical protein